MDQRASKPRWPIAALALSAAMTPLVLQAQSYGDVSDVESSAPVDETPSLWFVEFASEPATEGTSDRSLSADHAAFRAAAAAEKLNFRERYSYSKLWNGVSVEIDPDDLGKLRRLAGVKAIYPVMKFTPPRPSAESGVELVTAIKQTGADIAQSELGLTGAGVKVAIMDTGVDYDHPDLGGCFGPGCRVTVGWDFVGDDFNADDTSPTYNPIATPDPFPDDCNGHGTHVAGIVGANGAIRGVAPDVTFGAYRVFGCDGSTTSEIMLQAMERAYADGMDILNMSIGASYQWPEYPTAIAASRLVNKGMVVVTSIGNSGANGLYSASAPGVGKHVIGTASFDNTDVLLPAFTISPDNTKIGWTGATAAAPTPTSGSFPMARTGTSTTVDDGCAALPAGSLAGHVVLIRRGTCGFVNKAANAQAAGAAGVVLYNNAPGFINPTVAPTPEVPVVITIPVVAITAAEGELIDSRLTAGPVTMTWTTETVSITNPTGNLISSFSSYGLAPDLSLKPDIGAPGGSINSTYPLELGGNANISGTSMASPHVAGAAALLLQHKPNTNAGRVRDILQNSADPKVWGGNPGLGFLDNVHRQGAGMVDIDDAILSTTTIMPGKLSLGEGEKGPTTHELKVKNSAREPVTYNLSYVNALSTGGTITPSFFASNATVAFDRASVTVPGKSEVTFKATVTPATGPVNGMYGGYIVLTQADDSDKVYRVPFAGFVGDYQGMQVLTPTANGFPWLAKLAGGTYSRQTGPATYTMEGDDVPFFLAHFDHQSSRFQMKVTQMRTNSKGEKVSYRSWHKIVDEKYFGRNSSPTGFFAIAWDGQTFAGQGQTFTVPDGEYVVTISVLKALGDSTNKAHTETWESPLIIIDRP